jgi:ABC-type Mn2+/Zn2+ transport system permease subunit
MDFFLRNLTDYHNAIVVGLALAAACSVLSVFVVLRRMAMITEAVAHSGIGGLGVALLLAYFFDAMNNSVAIHTITGIFCLSTAFLIGYFTKGRHVSEDSAIGIFLVSSVALGILLLDYRATLPRKLGQVRAAEVEKILFGDLLSVNTGDVWLAIGAMLAVFLVVLALYNEFVYTTLDEEMARINGVNTRLVNLLQLSLVSLLVVVGARMAGAMLITAIMILPGATAGMLSRRFNGVLMGSLLVGILGVGSGLLVAVNPPAWRFSSGPVLVLMLFLVFLAVWLWKRFVKPKVGLEKKLGAAPHDRVHLH